jgi:hypothetical protein
MIDMILYDMIFYDMIWQYDMIYNIIQYNLFQDSILAFAWNDWENPKIPLSYFNSKHPEYKLDLLQLLQLALFILNMVSCWLLIAWFLRYLSFFNCIDYMVSNGKMMINEELGRIWN